MATSQGEILAKGQILAHPTNISQMSKEKQETRIRLTRGFLGREGDGEHPKIKQQAMDQSLDSASLSERPLSN